MAVTERRSVPEDVIRHMELAQAVVSRMAGNAFLVKGWSVTLAAALFALAAREADVRFAMIALFPAISFWVLDAYYLRQERLFRCLYDGVRHAWSEDGRGVEPFSMATGPYQTAVPGIVRLMFVRSVFLLHGIVLGAILVVLLLVRSAGAGGMKGAATGFLQLPL